MTDSIFTEVRDFIQSRLDAGIILRADWVTAEILASKTEPECEDADFYLLCARDKIADVVRRCLGKFKPATETDDQLRLPGFDHLQKAYPVERGGESLLVPVDLLTVEELEARAAEYDAMASGCRAHARELREFARRASVAA